MKNKEKLTPFIIILVVVVLAFLLPIITGGILRESIENLVNGALAIAASTGFTIWEINYNQKEDKKKKLKLDEEKLKQENRKNERTAKLEIDSLLFLMNDFPNLVSENKRISIIKTRRKREKDPDNFKLTRNMLERVKNYRTEFYKNIHGVERALILLKSTTDEQIEAVLEIVNRLQSDFYDLERDLDFNEIKQFGFIFLQCKKEDIIQEMIKLQTTLSKIKIGRRGQNYQDKINCLNGYKIMTDCRSIIDDYLNDEGEVRPQDIAEELDSKTGEITLPQEVERYGESSKDKARFIMKLWVLRNDRLKNSKPYLNKKNPVVDFGKNARESQNFKSYYLRVNNGADDSGSDSSVYTEINWIEK